MNEAENIKKYEMSYLLLPEISEEKLGLETADLSKIIRESSGEVTGSDNPKKRWLSYEIKKQRQAYFGVIYFKIPTEGINKIKNVLLLHKKMLRFLIVSYSEITLNKGRVDDTSKTINPELKSSASESQATSPDEPIDGQSFERKLESILNG